MVTYRFRDEFLTPESAPVTSPRTAEPGPGSWVVTDTNNLTSILATGNGRLRVSGNNMVWEDPQLWTFDSLDRADVGAVFGIIRVHGWSNHHGLFVASSQAPANPQATTMGVTLHNGEGSNPIGPNVPRVTESDGTTRAYLGIPGTYNRAIDYGVCVIPRDGGGFWVLMTGGQYGTFPNGRRIWISNHEAWEDLWVGITSDSSGQGSTYNVSSVRVIDKADIPSAWLERYHTALVADAFGGSGSLDERSVEIGTETWALADSSVDGTISGGEVTNAGNLFGYLNRATNVQVVEATWRQETVDSNNANRFVGLIFRGTGTAQSNFHRLAFFANDNGWVLWNGSSRVDPVFSQVPPVIGQTYTMRLFDTGTSFTVYILDHSSGNWTRLWNNFSYSVSSGGTRVGFYSGTNDRSVLSEFVVWDTDPAIVLPEDVGPMPSLAAPGDTIYQSDFEVGSTQSLHGFETDALNPSGWVVQENWGGGSIGFEINATTNTVHLTQPIPNGDFHLVGTRDVDTANHAVETVIHLDSDPAENYMVGVVLRFADFNNWIIARYLEQGLGNDDFNEIEVWQRVNGGTAFLMPMVDMRTLYQAGDTVRLRAAAVGDQLYFWHATGAADLELVAQGHIDPGLMAQTRCGIAVMASPNFAGSEPEWESVILSEAALADAPDPADIVWTAPAADATLSGIVDLVTETEDNRVTTVQYRIGETVLGTTGPDE